MSSIVKKSCYSSNNLDYEKNIAVYVHTLKQGGSQRAVESLLKRFKKKNYGMFIFSPTEGEYMEKYKDIYEANVFVLDDNISLFGEERENLSYFNIIIINSLCSYRYAYYYANTNIPCIWWIHETETVIKNGFGGLDSILLGSRNYIFAFPWIEPMRYWERLFPKSTIIHLPIEVEDTYKEDFTNVETDTKFRILIPGSYQIEKGFHVALEALIKLDAMGINDYEATFCGYIGNEEYYATIAEWGKKNDNINVLKEVSKEEMDKLIRQSDCVVIPSIFDAGPLTAVETMVQKKIVIISDTTGVANFLNDCDSAFVFKSENSEDLLKRILMVYYDKVKLQFLSEKGRKIYEKHFSESVVDSIFEGLLNFLKKD